MVKQKLKPIPLFLTFANLDLLPNEQRTTWTTDQWEEHIKAELQRFKKNTRVNRNLAAPLRKSLRIAKEKNTLPTIIRDVLCYHEFFRELLYQLAYYGEPRSGFEISEDLKKLMETVQADLDYSRKAGKFRLEAIHQTDSIFSLFAAELLDFLINDFKPSSFGMCALTECNKLILTANGRKYCCSRHSRREYSRNYQRENEARRRNTLNKRFNRAKKAGQISSDMSFERYLSSIYRQNHTASK